MSWEVEMVKIVRWLIDDRDATPENSDPELEEAIVVAAQMTQREANFGNVYLIDVDTLSISPDPTTTATAGEAKDNAFINLVSLKTACIVCNGEAKNAARCALSVSDGLSKIDSREKAKWLVDIASSACKAYEDALFEFKVGQNVAGEAILGPFSDGNPKAYYGFPEHGPRSRIF